ncbi:glutaredoxin 3 [Candidatus Blochmanniella vafra str. BVAF]|uniref:Glutaredoxin n=1 Tax=Blochmanniella vafra (strain BVAF) TaxID=859654 RepID=E8Q784_BLOVB|nr:glutaredoxin 3 [Candidatus Blochmannia vafer]ADV33979.1 glutaredoxin 3 [Candidatus Blochmannia vafer str. BVAF]
MSYNIEIYIRKGCPYCDKAKSFLKSKSLNFKEIFVGRDSSDATYLEMRTRSGGCVTVPQIFINGKHIGGSDDLLKFNDDQEALNLVLK